MSLSFIVITRIYVKKLVQCLQHDNYSINLSSFIIHKIFKGIYNPKTEDPLYMTFSLSLSAHFPPYLYS